MAVFDPLVPTGLVRLDQDYQNLQNNMQALDNTMAINHFKFSQIVNNGKHNFVEMPVRTVVPPGLAVNEVTLYNKAAGGASQLFMTRGVAGPEIQLTAGTNQPTALAQGQTFLPGGILLIWDFVAVTSTSQGTVTFPFSGFPNNCFNVFTSLTYPVAGSPPNGKADVSILRNGAQPPSTGFTWAFLTDSGAYSGFWYVAIGN